ncbi:MAG: ribokinase [Faecousia sp.]
MRDKIVVIGSMNYDIILKLSRFPQFGETFPADDAVFSPGGKGANQAVQAAKLGIPTYLAGCVGNDSQGAVLIQAAKEFGVNTDYVRVCDTPTGMGIVNALPDGSVKSVIVRGANYAITEEDIDALAPLMAETALVILQMEIPAQINRYAIDKAKSCGCAVLMNAAPAAPFEAAYLSKLDILVVNEVEAEFYVGYPVDSVDAAKQGAVELSRRLGISCVFTLGKLGSVVCSEEDAVFIPAKKVNAVETTGAGDSFIGALGYGLLHGKTLPDACRFATECSAVTVCRCGAQPSMPWLAEMPNV